MLMQSDTSNRYLFRVGGVYKVYGDVEINVRWVYINNLPYKIFISLSSGDSLEYGFTNAKAFASGISDVLEYLTTLYYDSMEDAIKKIRIAIEAVAVAFGGTRL